MDCIAKQQEEKAIPGQKLFIHLTIKLISSEYQKEYFVRCELYLVTMLSGHSESLQPEPQQAPATVSRLVL